MIYEIITGMTLSQCLDILELPRNVESVSLEEAKVAYRMLVQVWHPDKYCHNQKLFDFATAKMKEINSAWELVEANFKSGAASAIKRVTQDDTDDYRTEISEVLRGFINRRFGFY